MSDGGKVNPSTVNLARAREEFIRAGRSALLFAGAPRLRPEPGRLLSRLAADAVVSAALATALSAKLSGLSPAAVAAPAVLRTLARAPARWPIHGTEVLLYALLLSGLAAAATALGPWERRPGWGVAASAAAELVGVAALAWSCARAILDPWGHRLVPFALLILGGWCGFALIAVAVYAWVVARDPERSPTVAAVILVATGAPASEEARRLGVTERELVRWTGQFVERGEAQLPGLRADEVLARRDRDPARTALATALATTLGAVMASFGALWALAWLVQIFIHD